MQTIAKAQLAKLLDYESLIRILDEAFQEEYTVPLRHHHNFQNPKATDESTLLLMPAWQTGGFLGVKLIVVTPDNHQRQLPSIQGTYTLFDANIGSPLAQLDAKELTNRRTAAASALAARYLARPDSQTLLLVGTGSLAPHLIQAHATGRNLQQVLVWGRSLAKAERVAKQFSDAKFTVEAVQDLEAAVAKADIISCATLSKKPLVKGAWLQAGQHLDLVGSFKPNMRETDDAALLKSSVFADFTEGASRESGDLAIPLREGVISLKDIQSDLFGLCGKAHPGRQSAAEITLFKSVGHALEDLAAAKLAYGRLGQTHHPFHYPVT